MKIADVHAHIFPEKIAAKAARSIGDFYDAPPGNLATADVYLQEAKEAGICRALVCNSAVSPEQVPSINLFLAEQCHAHPEFLGLGSLYPGMAGWEEELDKLQAYGLRGVKIHPDFQRVELDVPAGVPMYREIARRGMVVLFHMGDSRYDYSHPRRLWELKRQVPDLIAIAAHFGGYQAWEASKACPMPEGIWYDTSSSLMFLSRDEARELLERFGTERFLFGSDFPMWTPGIEVERFLRAELGLSEAERDAILYDNFARLFGI